MSLDQSRLFWATVGAVTGTVVATAVYYASKNTYEQYIPLQAKTAGDQLVVGLIPDSEILRCKGPPVQTEDERLVLVDAVKWVDEVITGVPYDLSPEFLHELFTKHRIDYIVHGDDPCLLPDGTDAYAHAKALGRFRMIKRTEGVSTTDIVGRMLTCTRVNPTMLHPDQEPACLSALSLTRWLGTSAWGVSPAAKAQGEFLLVGLHTDEDVQERRGPHLPIMNLHERSLSVLACKFVDEVIMGSPTVITDDLIKTFNIHLVVRGTVSETGHHEGLATEPCSSGTTSPTQGQPSGGLASEHVKTEAAYYSDKKEYVAEL
ncbi:uncharacterized protein HaLaN_07331 [Haematococcus lacustris]|uniref:ethanolamine-phosphate cytidylyltransferase n=1 Tax=Haematococcus lacustris TaxID=44745 RepID=A0A699YRA7_HAELA|nr:uncharacterized protein HaLaN_07331 [Haematococcus lacustris]